MGYRVASFRFGLRAKSMLALVLACLLASVPAGLIAWQVLASVRSHFGEAYARNFTLLKRQSIVAPIARDLALAQRLADSQVTRQWLRDEQNLEKQAFFFKEAEGYRRDFSSRSYFISSAASRRYWLNDDKSPRSEQPRDTLEPGKESSSWFFSTLAQGEPYNINVDDNPLVHTTQVWLNILVRDGGQVLGIAGTGLDLGAFIEDFVNTDEAGVTPMLINAAGTIQAHRNKHLIAINQAAGRAAREQTLAGHLGGDGERSALARALADARARPGEVRTLGVHLDGKAQLLALAYIPELEWHVVTAVDLQAAHVLDQGWLNAAAIALVLLVGIFLLAFGYAVEKLVLRPLGKLRQSASALAQGNFAVSLPPPSQDELGDLSQAFGIMAEHIRSHTEELEAKVQARTQALEEANRDMRRAHQQINDSIDYASLIQQAMLPDRQLARFLGPDHFVLWRPRNVVGGDFYVFRSTGERCMLGVVDCAGHGVPGALMTMLARAALDQAMTQAGLDSPAAVLAHTDSAMRGMLEFCQLPRAIATNMDVGLALVDRRNRSLRYAGAKIGLYWSDGREVGEIKGGRRAIGDRRAGQYADAELPLPAGMTCYLTTDGFLDQAGGELGYGFGNTRFRELLQAHAGLPMTEQAGALERALEDYRGDHPQRDDITILSFRFD